MDAVVSLLIQVPLVGIFVWFTLSVMKQNQLSSEKRDGEWRDFLREQRESSNHALSRIAEEVKVMSQQLAAMQSMLTQHDLAMKHGIEKVSKPEREK
jgi:Na+/phosphate symporter